jgi:hypothetical protein
MASVRKEVTGVAASLASTYDSNPMGGTDKGPGPSGRATGKKYLKDAQGYYNQAPMQNGKPVAAPQPEGALSKGPQAGSLGRTGTSLSGGGNGRFGSQDQKKTGSGPDMGNRVK